MSARARFAALALVVVVLLLILAACGGGDWPQHERDTMPVECRANPKGCA